MSGPATLAQAAAQYAGLPPWIGSAIAGAVLTLVTWFFRRLLSDLEGRSDRAQTAADRTASELAFLRNRVDELERRCSGHDPVLRACESCQRARLVPITPIPFAAPEGAE